MQSNEGGKSMRILVLWEGERVRDPAQVDMYKLISTIHTLRFAEEKTFLQRYKEFKPDVVWLDIYHPVYDYFKFFEQIECLTIIDQADNEDFIRRKHDYSKLKNKVFLTRYLTPEIKAYCNPLQLSWYVDPNRFTIEKKTIDVAYICTLNKPERREKARVIQEYCQIIGLTAFVGQVYGDSYSSVLSKTKVFYSDSSRKCLTQKYYEAIYSGCTLVGDKPIYPVNDLEVYPTIKEGLERPFINQITSNFLKEFEYAIKDKR